MACTTHRLRVDRQEGAGAGHPVWPPPAPNESMGTAALLRVTQQLVPTGLRAPYAPLTPTPSIECPVMGMHRHPAHAHRGCPALVPFTRRITHGVLLRACTARHLPPITCPPVALAQSVHNEPSELSNTLSGEEVQLVRMTHGAWRCIAGIACAACILPVSCLQVHGA